MSKRKLDDGGPSSSKSGMASPSNPSTWKKARHEGLKRTKLLSIVVDVPFHIPNMQDIVLEPRNFLGVCLNFVDMCGIKGEQ